MLEDADKQIGDNFEQDYFGAAGKDADCAEEVVALGHDGDGHGESITSTEVLLTY